VAHDSEIRRVLNQSLALHQYVANFGIATLVIADN
jgi:hypothetical protein